jgi:hypothetical protein
MWHLAVLIRPRIVLRPLCAGLALFLAHVLACRGGCVFAFSSLALGSDLTAGVLPAGPVIGESQATLSGRGCASLCTPWTSGWSGWLMCRCAREPGRVWCVPQYVACVCLKCVHVGWCTVDVCVPPPCFVTGPPGPRAAEGAGGVSKPCLGCMWLFLFWLYDLTCLKPYRTGGMENPCGCVGPKDLLSAHWLASPVLSLMACVSRLRHVHCHNTRHI